MSNFKQAARGNYRSGRGYSIEYIVVHYTANAGDTAKNNADYFARVKTGTSAHYFVDANEVWQSVADTDTAYHCGASSYRHPYCRNANSIGVEMCDSLNGVPEAVRSRTIAFVRELMKTYSVPVEHVLRHYDVTGKRCPAPWVDNAAAWDAFKKELEEPELTQTEFDAMLENWLNRRAAEPADDWAKPYIAEAIDAGLMADVGGTIERPRSFVTREELATVAAGLKK